MVHAGVNCPGTPGTVLELELLSCVPTQNLLLAKMSRKFYSIELHETKKNSLLIGLVNSLVTFIVYSKSL